MGAISCFLKFIFIYTLIFLHVSGMAFGAFPSNNIDYKLKRLPIKMALRQSPASPPPPQIATRRGPGKEARPCKGPRAGQFAACGKDLGLLSLARLNQIFED
ncbi:unnamed protein product [Dovyalis caffra]|uniref:Uncharacterized protein n=1 Tax=Dovyalis caffra TaxID=77055 RepID=A0AAV1RXG5_9ROSI|nr:unnamed protein product [Dovyalis caffra]